MRIFLTSAVMFLPGAFQKLRNAFFTVFDHPPTYGKALAIILLKNHHTRVCNSNALALALLMTFHPMIMNLLTTHPPLLRDVICE